MEWRNSGGRLLPGRIATLRTAFLTAAAAGAWLVLPLLIGVASAGMNPGSGIQAAVLAGLLFPAVLLAVLRPQALVGYSLFIWAAAPEIRRIYDWAAGVYNPVSVLSLAPLLAGAALIIPVLRGIHLLKRPQQTIMLLFAGALGYGTLVGLAKNGLGSVYDLANYLVPLLLIPYFSIVPFSGKDIDRVLRTFANLAVLVAVYGIVQYMVVPPWDAFWMNNADMMSIGRPYPLEVRVFSSLNSPGPAAAYLAFALVPMMLEKRWRGTLGWAGVAAVAVCLLTTQVRSAWLVLLVMVAVYILTSSSKGKWKTLIQLGFLAGLLFWIVPKLPGAEVLTARMETLGSVQEDHSYNERLQLWQTLLPTAMNNPIGEGIGSVGQGTKLGNDGELGEFGIMDNGLIALLLTFGPAGALVFGAAFLLIFRRLASKLKAKGGEGDYVRLALATWAAAAASLMSENAFPGIKGYLIWMLVGIGLGVMKGISTNGRKEKNDAAVGS